MTIGRFQNVRASEYDKDSFSVFFDFDGGISAEIITAALEDMREGHSEICAIAGKPTDAQPIPETITTYIGVRLILDEAANMDLNLDFSVDFTDGLDHSTSVREILTEEEATAFKSIALEIFRAHYGAIFDGLAKGIRKATRAA